MRSVALAPGSLAGAAGILALFLLPGLGLSQRGGAARRCRRCGRPFCRRCRVGTKDPDHCSQCVHLYILRDGLAPVIKSRKMDEVTRYRKRVWIGERLLSLPLPGSGHVLGGRPCLGALLLVSWIGAWLGILLHGRMLVAPDAITASAVATSLLLGSLALVVWLVGNLSAHEAERD